MTDQPTTPPEKEVDPGSAFYQERLKDSLKNLDQAAQDISDGTKANFRRVPEPYFVAHLLPILRKWIINDPKDPAEPGLWFNVADGLHHPIYVVDAEQNVLFETPLLFVQIPDRDPLKNHRLNSVHQMVSVQGMMMDNSDHRAGWQMEQEIVQTLTPSPEVDEKTKNLILMVKIYQRYNLPLEEILGEEVAAEIRPSLAKEIASSKPKQLPSPGISEDDEFIFDD